jgi:hypothetical protein
MGLFGKKKPGAQPAADFDVVVRSLVAEMSGDTVTERGNDTIAAGGHETFLGNLRAGWDSRAPDERDQWLRAAVQGLYHAASAPPTGLDVSMLRPGIRSQWMTELPMLLNASRNPERQLDESNRIAARPMADGLSRVLIVDSPTTMTPISNRMLQDWGADFDELWPVAVQNLAAEPFQQAWKIANECLWISPNEDDYTAERMFLPGFAESTGIEWPVVFHPNRTTLMVADLNNPDSVQLGAGLMVQQFTSTPNAVSLTPIVGKGLDWYPLTLQPGHPAIPAVDRLRLLESKQTYDAQKSLLEQIHGEDLFVANFMAYDRPDGDVLTVASWTEGVPTLLPRAQNVSIVADPTGTADVFHVPWQTAERVVGHLMEPTGYYPERFRVVGFPSPAELEALRKMAI